MDSLALREHVRVIPIRRLRLVEPLQRRALLGRGERDRERGDRALGRAAGDGHRERTAVWFGARRHGPGAALGAVDADALHVQEGGVEHDLLRCLVREGLELQCHGAMQFLVLEIDRQVGDRVLRLPLIVVGEGVGITCPVEARHGPCQGPGPGRRGEE